MQDYKPPSMFAQYKGLAIMFAMVLLAVAVYFIKLPRTPLHIEPPTQEVYIDPVAQKTAPIAPSAPPAGSF